MPQLEPRYPLPSSGDMTNEDVRRLQRRLWCSRRNGAEEAPCSCGECDHVAEVATKLLESDALTPNHDGTPEHYIVDAENVEYLVRTVLDFAKLGRSAR